MKKVFVSGCYDIVHAGHIQFFEEARALGDYLIVSFASEPVLWHHKQRKPSIPDEHKKVLLESLRMVDKVILGTGMKKGLDIDLDYVQAFGFSFISVQMTHRLKKIGSCIIIKCVIRRLLERSNRVRKTTR